MKNIILKHCLKNALDFQGKVNAKVVLGLTLKEKPELKNNVPKVLQEIETIVKKVESWSLEQVKKELKIIAPELLKPEIELEAGPLKPLPNAKKGKVIVRIAPSPSGPLHIGHAYGVSLNYEYAKMYQGKLILRIEDTNPENIYPHAYELIERDARWLTDNGVSEVVIQSSRLGIYYDYAEKLIQSGKAYICTCEAELWRELKNKGQACSCRGLTVKEHQKRYAKMFGEYAEGEAVVRLKTDIEDKNPAMRDFGIMRIVEHVHPKTGKEQRIWPLMLFAVAIDDHELGVTHVLNGKDHTDNAIKEQMIMDCFGWKHPEYKHWGMINFAGFELSTSNTRKAIEQQQYGSWEDIRLPFLPALRRRGYQAGAFRRFALEIGLSLHDKTVTMNEFWKSINAFNREVIEPLAKRYFFINNPVSIKVQGLDKKSVSLPYHPDYPQQGRRQLNVTEKLLISKNDFQQLAEGYIHRLMDLCNIEIKGKIIRKVSDDYDSYKNSTDKGKIIHWLPAQENLVTKVVMDNGVVITGAGEENLLKAKTGDIVQLERFAFCTIDKIEHKQVTLWYLHK